jgi:hypothetical protein
VQSMLLSPRVPRADFPMWAVPDILEYAILGGTSPAVPDGTEHASQVTGHSVWHSVLMQPVAGCPDETYGPCSLPPPLPMLPSPACWTDRAVWCFLRYRKVQGNHARLPGTSAWAAVSRPG